MGNGSTAFDGARNPVRVALVGSQRLVGGVLALALSRDPRLVVVTQILDPAQALRECHDCLPDVVALDLAPAAADPLGALAALTAGRPDCPVLVLTALEDEAMLTRALGCGARGYLTAESSLAELADSLVAVAEGATVVAARPLTAVVRRTAAAQRLSGTQPALDSWAASLIAYLTPREQEVLRLLADGRSTLEMAASLGITRHTTRTHIQNLLTKLGLSSRLAAAAFAVHHGVV